LWKLLLQPIAVADLVSIYDGPYRFLEDFQKVKRAAGNLFAAQWCYTEVCNGGFEQFFGNSTGVLAPEAAAGFRAIGAVPLARIVKEAMSKLGDPYPRDREERNEILMPLLYKDERPIKPFEEIEERFYAWLHKEPDRWEKLADAYAAQFI